MRYWRVGREREARFQWDQALTLKPEPEDAEKIKKKLQKGLPPPPRRARSSAPRRCRSGPIEPKKSTRSMQSGVPVLPMSGGPPRARRRPRAA